MSQIVTRHHKTHSIERVVFTLELGTPVEADEVKLLDDWWKSDLQEKLPRRNEGQNIKLEIGPNGTISTDKASTGVRYEAFRPDGILRLGLRAEDNLVQVVVTEYLGWDKIWPPVYEMLMAVAQKALNKKDVVAIHLLYIDEFFYEQNDEHFKPSLVLRNDGGLLPDYIFDQSMNWHNHTGYFSQACRKIPFHVLNRVNVDQLDQKNAKLIRIKLEHRAIFEAVPVSKIIESPELLSDTIEFLHNEDKDLLGKIINDEMQRKIQLWGEGD